MSNKILTKAIVLAPLAAILINPSVVLAKEKPDNISITKQEVIVAQKVKYEEEKQAFFGEKAVKYKGKWGFIDDTGKMLTTFKYDDVNSFSENMAGVKLDGKWGYIDTTGEEVIPPKYDDVERFNNGLAAVSIDRKWGLIDKNGEVKCKIEFDSIFNNEEMFLIRVNLDGMTGYINRDGKTVVPAKYNEVINYNDEAVVVRIKKKWGVCDSTGQIAVPLKYDMIDNVNIYHDDRKGVTKLYVNAILKKKELFFSVEAKSKKDAKGNYVYQKWKKNQSKRISGKI